MPWNTEVYDSNGIISVPDVGPPTADIIVRADGGGDYTTIQAGINAAAAGEIIEIQANTEFGTQTFNEYLSIVSTATAGNERQLRVRDGDRVNVYPTATSNAGIFEFSGASYWIIDGSVGELYIGDRSLWSGTSGGQDTYPYDFTLRCRNTSHHIEFKGQSGQNLHFSGAKSYYSIYLEVTCHHLAMRFCDGYGHGNVKVPTTTAPNVSADGLICTANNCLFEDCNWDAPFGGHNGCTINGYEIVFRRCSFKRDYATYTNLSSDTGYRAFTFVPVEPSPGQTQITSVAPWGPAMMEDCMIHECGDNYSLTDDHNYKLGTKQQIFRYNYVFDNRGRAALVSGYRPSPSPDNSTESTRCYNNTEYNNINWVNANAQTSNSAIFQELWWTNNIVASCTQEAMWQGFDTVIFLARNWNNLDPQTYGGDTDPGWLGAKFDGNMIDATGTSIKLGADAIDGGGTETSLANAISQWPDNWLSTNNTNAPTFVDAAARTRAGFALQSGSNGEDEAEPLATVTANSSGTAVTLDDCYWIYDGYGLSYFGEEGDYIAFYDSTGTTLKGIRQVSSVNSKTSVTLTTSITIVIGDIVFPVLSNGVTVVTNKGAAQ